MNSVYEKYLIEKRFQKRISVFSRLLSISYVSIYLYLLFTSGYMANPLIVLINYLAIYTTASGLILFKYFEIPEILLNVKKIDVRGTFLDLSRDHQELVWANLSNPPNLPEKVSREWILNTLKLDDRFNWKRIGKIYFIKYLLLFLLTTGYLLTVYFETGFQ
ncbi:MAG: hypothetical protein O9301_09880 [Leptospira sp.]|nr:hypothetical protein [Leptospira sp.]